MSANSRRDFLIAAASAAAGLTAQPQKRSQAFRAGVCVGARDKNGFIKVCDDCSQASFHYIESSGGGVRLADVYAGSPAELKEELEKRRLALAGYAQYSEMSDPAKRAEVLDLHIRIGHFLRPLGARYITQLWIPPVKPGIPADQLLKHVTPADYRNFGIHANEIGKRLQNETGVRIGYHPEREDVAAGLVDPVMEATDPRYFDFIPDVGHLAAGGLDPLQVYKKYRSRIIATHFRDYDPKAEFERNGKTEKGRFVPLGQGVVDLHGLAAYLKQADFKGQVNAEGGRLDANRDYLTGALALDLDLAN